MSAPPRKRVFILGGGAALGAMRFLEEQGVTPDAIVGSSIGVINASLYASGGVDNMEEAWLALADGGSFFRPSRATIPSPGARSSPSSRWPSESSGSSTSARCSRLRSISPSSC